MIILERGLILMPAESRPDEIQCGAWLINGTNKVHEANCVIQYDEESEEAFVVARKKIRSNEVLTLYYANDYRLP